MRRSLAVLAVVLAVAGSAAGGLALRAQSPARAQDAAPAGGESSGSFVPPAAPGLITILVLGSDARPGEPIARLRSDSIHLVTINPRTGAGTVLGFPRDSYVAIPGRGSARINEAMAYGGPQLTEATIESLTGIHIDYYVLASFQGFSDLVDGIGGIVVDVPYDMQDPYSGANFRKGRTKLNGTRALAFARDRHSVPGGDFGRSENQGRLLLAALRQLRQDFAVAPASVTKWVVVAARHVTTDLTIPELFRLGAAATRIRPSRVTNVVVPGSVGMVGSASVVFVAPSARALFADIRDDGAVNG